MGKATIEILASGAMRSSVELLPSSSSASQKKTPILRWKRCVTGLSPHWVACIRASPDVPQRQFKWTRESDPIGALMAAFGATGPPFRTKRPCEAKGPSWGEAEHWQAIATWRRSRHLIGRIQFDEVISNRGPNGILPRADRQAALDVGEIGWPSCSIRVSSAHARARSRAPMAQSQDIGSDGARRRRSLNEEEEHLALEPGALIEQPHRPRA